MLIAGSRPVGRWISSNQPLEAVEGSPLDRLVLTVLILCAVFTFTARKKAKFGRIVKENAGIILLFVYMLLSILWAENPFVSLKRWIKSAGPILLAVAILSESKPLDALASIFRRCAYILIPFSVVLIKYFPEIGRAYHSWSGLEMWTGVTTHKNSLGQVCALSSFFFLWELLRGNPSGGVSRTRVHVCADIFVLAVAVYLLVGPGAGAYSASSIFISVFGVTAFMVLVHNKALARRLVNNFQMVVVLMAGLYLLLADVLIALVTVMLGRNEDLTGRATEIWPLVLDAAARHPILGAGYGGAWGLGGDLSTTLLLEQAHNGYIDVYLELGIMGLVFLAVFFLNFCIKVKIEYRHHDSEWGLLGFCYVLMMLSYNLSETAFFDVYLGVAMVLMAIVLGGSSKSTINNSVGSNAPQRKFPTDVGLRSVIMRR
jgi:O-antigen ligase